MARARGNGTGSVTPYKDSNDKQGPGEPEGKAPDGEKPDGEAPDAEKPDAGTPKEEPQEQTADNSES